MPNPFKMGGNSQQLQLNIELFSSDTIPVNIGLIYGLSIDADINLYNDNSYIRITLDDEYLIYEGYKLITDSYSYTVDDECEETIDISSGTTATSINIEIKDADINIKRINYLTSPLLIDKQLNHNERHKIKIDKINNSNQNQNKMWFADVTNVSEMSYKDKKKLYGKTKIPNGVEYYVGGIYSTDITEIASSAIEDVDWRDRNGINYITSIKNQGSCGSCWAFAAAGAVEAMTNIYFNQLLNLDLSEQQLISCSNAGGCDGGYPSIALNYIKNNGIGLESNFIYSGTDETCRDIPTYLRISGKTDFGSISFPKTEESLKSALIEGVISSGLYDWSHAMPLVGFKVLKEGDHIYFRSTGLTRSWITVQSGSTLIDKTVWLFKNSWGPYFGDLGYVYVDTPISNMGWTHKINTPIFFTSGLTTTTTTTISALTTTTTLAPTTTTTTLSVQTTTTTTLLPTTTTTTTLTPTQYCTSIGTGSSCYITSVKINGVTKISGNNGYSDFTSTIFNLTPGITYKVELISAGIKPIYSIWIDFNNDGIFENLSIWNNRTKSLKIPTSARGTRRMRISVKSNNAATSCEIGFNGEVEDYTVVFDSIASSIEDINTTNNIVIKKITSNNLDIPIFNTNVGEYENIMDFFNKNNAQFLSKIKFDISKIPPLLHGKGKSKNLIEYLSNNTDNDLIVGFIDYYIKEILQLSNINITFIKGTNWKNTKIILS